MLDALAFRRKRKQQTRRNPDAPDEDQDLAADALQMIASHHPHGPVPTGLIDQASTVGVPAFPFSAAPTAARLDFLLFLLPSDRNVDFLLGHVQDVERSLTNPFCWEIIYRQLGSLRQTLKARRSKARSSSSNVQPDLSFLALLFALLVAACEFSSGDELIYRGICARESQIVQTIDALHNASQTLLCMTDFMGNPNLNGILTIIAMKQYYFVRNQGGHYYALHVTAVGLAQLLHSHRLGSMDDDARKAPAGDSNAASVLVEKSQIGPLTLSSIEKGDVLVREASRRAWFLLLTQDWFSANTFGVAYTIHPGHFKTALPANLDEADLVAGRTKPIPWNMRPFAICQYSIVETNRKIVDKKLAGTLTYKDALEFDTAYRSAAFDACLQDLPSYFRFDGVTEHLNSVKAQHTRYPYLVYRRLLLRESLIHRLLTLHRGYMARGYREEKYAYSTRTCVEMARELIRLRKEIASMDWAGQQYWALRFHAFHSALALSMHLLGLADQLINSELEGIREDILTALGFLSRHPTRNSDPTFVRSGRKILDTILREEAARRHQPSSAAVGSAVLPPQPQSHPHPHFHLQRDPSRRDWPISSPQMTNVSSGLTHGQPGSHAHVQDAAGMDRNALHPPQLYPWPSDSETYGSVGSGAGSDSNPGITPTWFEPAPASGSGTYYSTLSSGAPSLSDDTAGAEDPLAAYLRQLLDTPVANHGWDFDVLDGLVTQNGMI